MRPENTSRAQDERFEEAVKQLPQNKHLNDLLDIIDVLDKKVEEWSDAAREADCQTPGELEKHLSWSDRQRFDN